MQVLIYSCAIMGLILAISFNLWMRRVARQYPSQLDPQQLSPSAKWRHNLQLQARLSTFSPQLYRQNRHLGFWTVALFGTFTAVLALLMGALEMSRLALAWPALFGISTVGYGVTRIKLNAAQLIGWQHLLQDAPQQAQQWQLAQVDLAKVQTRARALARGQYLLMAALLLIASAFELAVLTLLAW
ncbi:MAG: hypothetical protein LKJ69_06695 [Lactobacillus sp.]|jgi:prepilin signal peptidase PulO-like enzyme (type II secretory pathway)|nr:hypothetical protein [Lactobacillus sp.]